MRCERLNAVNDVERIAVGGHPAYQSPGQSRGQAGRDADPIPLVIKKQQLEQAVQAAGDTPLLELLPYKLQRAGLVTTGNEVFYGRIQDTFTPVVKAKLAAYGIQVEHHRMVPDDMQAIRDAVLELKELGCEMIVTTGGMSVDPDDQTPGAIKQTGARVVSYGAPVLPGAMFLLAYFEDGTPVLGLPGCVMYAAATNLDLVLPRVAAGVELTRRDITGWGQAACAWAARYAPIPTAGLEKESDHAQADRTGTGGRAGMRRSASPGGGGAGRAFAVHGPGAGPGYDQPAAQPAL